MLEMSVISVTDSEVQRRPRLLAVGVKAPDFMCYQLLAAFHVQSLQGK